MPEHLIRLRGGWELIDPDAVGEPHRRLTLPLRGTSGPGRRARLVRRFGRPPVAGPGQTLWLRIAHAPGLAEIRLNGSLISLGGMESGPEEIPLSELPPRNELEIEVPAHAQADPGWGEFTLVIRDVPAR